MKEKIMSKIKNINIADYLSISSIIILVIIFSAINKNFVNTINLKNILTDMAPLLVMGCGVTFVLLIGSIDLSIGAVASASAVLLAVLIPSYGYASYFAAIAFGIIAGFLNGILYTKIKIPSFIATLGTMSIWQSFAYILSDGAPLQIQVSDWGFISWAKIKIGIVSIQLMVALILLLMAYMIQTRTKLGKYIYAIGGNERASRVAGVNNDWVKILVFTLCGVGSAIAGILLAIKLKSGIPTVGVPFNLMGIAAVALGGTSLSGGKGSVIGTLLGVALVIVIQSGMNVIGVNVFWQQITFGILVILAVLLTVDRSGRDVIIK